MKHIFPLKYYFHIVVNKIVIIFFLFPFVSFSQVDLNCDSITNNAQGITIFDLKKMQKNNEAVIFFCPKGLLKDSDYITEINTLMNDKRFKEFKGKLNLIFYYEDDINNSKNPFFFNIFSKDSIINQLQCYIVSNNREKIERANKLLSKFYKVNFDIIKTNVYKVDLIDLACPKNFASKTSLYLDFINEVFFPKYSTDELIEMLQKRILILENEMTNLKSELNNYKKELNTNSNLKDSNSESSIKKSKCKEEEE